MNRMNGEEFAQYLETNVKVLVLDETTMLTRDGKGVMGHLSYTTGLKDVFGYELLAFGAFDPEDLLASAKMIHANFPRGVAVEIPYELLKDLGMVKEGGAVLPEVPYRQFVLDESALEDESEKPSSEPLWIADGGYPILTDEELQTKLTTELEAREKKQHDHIEAVRQQYREKIERFGYTMVGVFDHEGRQPNFVYTVGLTNKDLPELIISGRVDMDFLSQVTGHFAQLMIDDGFALRKLVNVFSLQDGSEHDIRMVEIDPVYAKTNYLVQAEPILKDQVKRVVQLQISDGAKKFFGEEGYDDKLGNIEFAPVIAGGYPTDIEV